MPVQRDLLQPTRLAMVNIHYIKKNPVGACEMAKHATFMGGGVKDGGNGRVFFPWFG